MELLVFFVIIFSYLGLGFFLVWYLLHGDRGEKEPVSGLWAAFFYGVLAILLYRGMIGEGVNKKMAAIWALVLAIFYGVTDEYHQSFTQGREARIRDIGFDGIGATLGSTLVYNILPMMPKEVLKLAKEFQII